MVNLRIEPGGGQPLYVKIADAIRSEVDSGRLSEGDRLPPIRIIAEQCGVSEMPVKQAVRILVQEGALVSTRGRGTFVRKRADDGFVNQSERRHESGIPKMVVLFQHGLRPFASHLAPYTEEIEQALEKIHLNVAHAPSSIESASSAAPASLTTWPQLARYSDSMRR